jgi:PadR family transcriptional regulator, regulatory protein PadR
MDIINIDNTKAQMRKGSLEFIILLLIANGPVYSSDILQKLKEAELIVVEGTLYPLLSRLKNAELLKYDWQESKSGPPRKYYNLTKKGEDTLAQLKLTWKNLNKSINSLMKSEKIS